MGKAAIVTGGSRGIGAAIVKSLAADGFDVAIIYQGSKERAESLAEEIKATGRSAIAVQCDVSSLEQVEKMTAEVLEKLGSVDVLVNNAGKTKDGLIMRMTEEDFDSIINTNLKGAFNCTKAVTPIMMKARSGRIVNISSVVGVTGNAGQANYAASKAGIIGLTKSAAKELATRGITVNSVAPGYVKTDMTEVLSDKVKEAILAQIPMKKCAEPEDIANVVSFLCSDKASYVTGQVINVDGGMVM
ncbi:MAG: 3-oxoacyl-[acyl-carrier-protein] reductase [Clostridia bacterium]|nr:3-oxoacyl-[acyl-carrier-protein] reductase [Clostridia bacterium]